MIPLPAAPVPVPVSDARLALAEPSSNTSPATESFACLLRRESRESAADSGKAGSSRAATAHPSPPALKKRASDASFRTHSPLTKARTPENGSTVNGPRARRQTEVGSERESDESLRLPAHAESGERAEASVLGMAWAQTVPVPPPPPTPSPRRAEANASRTATDDPAEAGELATVSPTQTDTPADAPDGTGTESSTAANPKVPSSTPPSPSEPPNHVPPLALREEDATAAIGAGDTAPAAESALAAVDAPSATPTSEDSAEAAALPGNGDLPGAPEAGQRQAGQEGGEHGKDRDGTPHAQSNLSVKNTLEMNQVARSKEQDLPMRHSLSGAASHPGSAGSAEDLNRGALEPTSAWTAAPPAPPVASVSAAAESAAPEATDRAQAVDKMTELLARQAVELKHAGALHLTAVLRPDERTELHVSLRLAGDGIEMQARCERGDAQALNSQWPEIQRALAQQGVRLANLDDSLPRSFSSSPSSHPGGSDGSADPRGSRHPAVAIAEEESAGLSRGRAATVAPPSVNNARRTERRWESWA